MYNKQPVSGGGDKKNVKLSSCAPSVGTNGWDRKGGSSGQGSGLGWSWWRPSQEL